MIKKHSLACLLIIATLISCDTPPLQSETEAYKIELSEASDNHANFTNSINADPLKISAERINLKELLGMLLTTDTANIQFEDGQKHNQYYQLAVEQKDMSSPVNQDVLNEILDHLSLTLVLEKAESYNIQIQDSTKYTQFLSQSEGSISKVKSLPDSIEITNSDLSILAEALSSEFSKEVIYTGDSRKIDYAWEKMDFEALRKLLQNDLGLSFTSSDNDLTKFRVIKE